MGEIVEAKVEWHEVLLKLMNVYSQYDLYGDIRYAARAYMTSMCLNNEKKMSYKIATLISLFAIFAPFFVSYSGLNVIQNNRGTITDKAGARDCKSVFGRIGTVLYLSVLGPLVLLFA